MGCLVIECFPRTVVGLIHDRLDISVSYVLKTATLGKVLPNQTVGVPVQATPPRAVWMCKIHISIEGCLHFFVPRELFAIICGNRQGPVPLRFQQAYSGRSHDFRVFFQPLLLDDHQY